MSRLFRLLLGLHLVLAAAVILGHIAVAQDGGRAQEGVAFVSQSLAAMAVSGPVEDMTLSGTVTRIAGSTRENGVATLIGLKSGETSFEFKYPSGRRTEFYTSSAKGPVGGWSEADDQMHPIAFQNLLADPGWFSPLLVIERLRAKIRGATTAYVGDTQRAGKTVIQMHVNMPIPGQQASKHPAWIASLIRKAGEYDVYVDRATLLPTEMSFDLHPDKDIRRSLPASIRYSDYRMVNGMRVPFHIQKFVNETLTLDLHVQNVNLNQGLTAASLSAR